MSKSLSLKLCSLETLGTVAKDHARLQHHSLLSLVPIPTSTGGSGMSLNSEGAHSRIAVHPNHVHKNCYHTYTSVLVAAWISDTM